MPSLSINQNSPPPSEDYSKHYQEASAQQPIQRLLIAVIQIQDMRSAIQALEAVGLIAIRLASTGAFLERRNATLLIGTPAAQMDKALQVIQEYCRQRVEYVSTPLEGAPMPIPIATPITIGGATVFSLDVERFEEF